MDEKSLYAHILNLSDPWQVKSLSLDENAGSVTVTIEIAENGVASENGKNRTLSVRRCWNPAIQRRNGHAEVLGNVLGWHTAGQQLLG